MSEKYITLSKKDEKRLRGQFYTIENPFKHDLFFEWYNMIPNIKEEVFLEPFAGSNNIINMIQELNLPQPKNWKSYDISPSEINNAEEYKVEQRDTIKNFPKKFNVAITNPPYLAKNSATRRNLDYPKSDLDDLYKISLEVMLSNLNYVAAIIPESFITQKEFKDRLFGVISLNVGMFDDTECPVCLSLFIPEKIKDTIVYRGDVNLGTYNELKEELSLFEPNSNISIDWKFNDKEGNIGFRAIDNTLSDSIEFFPGEKVDPSRVKNSSRSITRISGVDFKTKKELNDFIKLLNDLIKNYREKTEDLFMTSFKGLRKDKRYRRRLSYGDARTLLNKAYEIFINKKGGAI